ncbi:fibronectin type III domain-containing protein [Chitinophaga flava]|uniref:fibronectin type III domain-containing protein n=1 Tax=Chitinophaga flava TaxID=2259036 RepID=UPI001379B76D|nr:fibronectin type III domain-containing protein [Chitinophaga flava]
MKRSISFLFLLFTFYFTNAQQYPVQGSLAISSPYPANLSDYANPNIQKLKLTLTLTDITLSNKKVKLKLFIQKDNTIIAQSSDAVMNEPAVILDGGVPQYFNSIDLATYFNVNNLQGITPNAYTQALPEGVYNIGFEVYDYFTGRRLSSRINQLFWLMLNDPPLLNMPANRENIQNANLINPQITFQWTPRSTQVSNTEYEFTLAELWDDNGNPYTQFLAAPPKFKTTTNSTGLLYGVDAPPLVPGRTYAWRVRARAKQGFEDIGLYRNDGYSEIFTFKYAGNCTAVNNVNIEVKGSDRLYITWANDPSKISYKVAYRKYSTTQTWEWFETPTTNTFLNLFDVEPDTQYEIKVGGICDNNLVSYTSPQVVRTLAKENDATELNCGQIPQINISNQTLVDRLSPNDVITAGDFPVTLTRVDGSNGNFSGEGWVKVPYLVGIKIKVVFRDIKVNANKQLLSGYLETVYDPKGKNVLDVDGAIGEVGGLINDIKQLVASVKQYLDSYKGTKNDKQQAVTIGNSVDSAYTALAENPYLTPEEIQSLKGEQTVAKEGFQGLAGSGDCNCGNEVPGHGPSFRLRPVDESCCKKKASQGLDKLDALTATAVKRENDLLAQYNSVKPDDVPGDSATTPTIYYPIDPAGRPVVIPKNYTGFIRSKGENTPPPYVIAGVHDDASKKNYFAVIEDGSFKGYHLAGNPNAAVLPVDIVQRGLPSSVGIKVFEAIDQCYFYQYEIKGWTFDYNQTAIADKDRIAKLAELNIKSRTSKSFDTTINPKSGGCAYSDNKDGGIYFKDYSPGRPGDNSGPGKKQIDSLKDHLRAINVHFDISIHAYVLNTDNPDYQEHKAEADNDNADNKIIITYNADTHEINLQHKITAPKWFLEVFSGLNVVNDCSADYINRGLDELHKSDLYKYEPQFQQVRDEIQVVVYRGLFGFMYCATNEESVRNSSAVAKYVAGALHEVVATIDVVEMVKGIAQLGKMALTSTTDSYITFYNDLKQTVSDMKNHTSVAPDVLVKRLLPPQIRSQVDAITKVAKVGDQLVRFYFTECDKFTLNDGDTVNMCPYRYGQVTVMALPIVVTAGEWIAAKGATLMASLALRYGGDAEKVASLLKAAEEANAVVARDAGKIIIKDAKDEEKIVTVIEKDLTDPHAKIEIRTFDEAVQKVESELGKDVAEEIKNDPDFKQNATDKDWLINIIKGKKFEKEVNKDFASINSTLIADFKAKGIDLTGWEKYEQVQLKIPGTDDYFIADNVFIKRNAEKDIVDVVLNETKLNPTTELTTRQKQAFRKLKNSEDGAVEFEVRSINFKRDISSKITIKKNNVISVHSNNGVKQTVINAVDHFKL